MFDGSVIPGHRTYRICNLGHDRWRVIGPGAWRGGMFSSIDGALAFVRNDCRGVRATVEVLSDALYLVKHLPAAQAA